MVVNGSWWVSLLQQFLHFSCLFFSFSKAGCLYVVALAILKLVLWTRLASNSGISASLCIPSACATTPGYSPLFVFVWFLVLGTELRCFSFPKDYFFSVLCMSACIHVCVPCVCWYPSRETRRQPAAGVAGGCEQAGVGARFFCKSS